MIDDNKVYELLIFQDQDLIFYYDPLNSISEPNYSELENSHRIQNLVGVSKSMNALIKQIYPSEQTIFRNFKTKEYQFNQYDTLNGLKVIMITSVRSDQKGEQAIKKIYESYLNYVKKNYLFEVGSKINVKSFKNQVAKLLNELLETH